MSLRACRRFARVLLAGALAGIGSSAAAAPSDTAAIAEAIKADVARLVAGINAHDPARATAYDSANIVAMECGSPPVVGIEADRQGFEAGFAHDPHWRVSLIDETVDVAGSGDLAVYRGTYHEDNGLAGVLTTHRTIFIAEFKRQRDDSWKIAWYSISNIERSHPK